MAILGVVIGPAGIATERTVILVSKDINMRIKAPRTASRSTGLFQ